MSTRAGIIIKDGDQSLHFYRHSAGYPDGTLPTLNIFLEWMKAGKIRQDLMQCAGWLVIIGALEYKTIPQMKGADFSTLEAPKDWKAGSYEPTTDVNDHGDLEFIYTIDIRAKTITYKETF